MPKEKPWHQGLGKVHRLGLNLKPGACVYLHALNLKAHECLSEPGMHCPSVPHHIRTGNGVESRGLSFQRKRGGAGGKGQTCAVNMQLWHESGQSGCAHQRAVSMILFYKGDNK